jgi:hypothetical protein
MTSIFVKFYDHDEYSVPLFVYDPLIPSTTVYIQKQGDFLALAPATTPYPPHSTTHRPRHHTPPADTHRGGRTTKNIFASLQKAKRLLTTDEKSSRKVLLLFVCLSTVHFRTIGGGEAWDTGTVGGTGM